MWQIIRISKLVKYSKNHIQTNKQTDTQTNKQSFIWQTALYLLVILQAMQIKSYSVRPKLRDVKYMVIVFIYDSIVMYKYNVSYIIVK